MKNIFVATSIVAISLLASCQTKEEQPQSEVYEETIKVQEELDDINLEIEELENTQEELDELGDELDNL